MTKKFITVGKGTSRRAVPINDRPKISAKVKVGVKIDPKLQLLKDIKKRGIITENELKLVFQRLNNKVYTGFHLEDMIGNGQGLKLTPEQNTKGYDYLMDQWKTPRGIDRKDNPFGYRETNVLDNFKEIRLVSISNIGTPYMIKQVPVYNVYGIEGSVFQYIWDGKGIKVIG